MLTKADESMIGVPPLTSPPCRRQWDRAYAAAKEFDERGDRLCEDIVSRHSSAQEPRCPPLLSRLSHVQRVDSSLMETGAALDAAVATLRHFLGR